jgi:hypothetical protein
MFTTVDHVLTCNKTTSNIKLTLTTVMRHLILFTRFGRRDKLQLYGLWSLLPLILLVSLHVSYVNEVATLDSTSKTLKKQNTKIQKRLMAGTIKEEKKRGGQRKAKRHTSHRNQEKGRKLILLMVGGNLIHHLSNVV